jgi:hypothetical protein
MVMKMKMYVNGVMSIMSIERINGGSGLGGVAK